MVCNYVDVHTKDEMNILNRHNVGTLAFATARSITLNLKARPCDIRAPRKQIMEEHRREKLTQHLIQVIVVP